MNFSASIPVANMQAANDLLNNTAQTPGKKSFGPNNFSVPAYTGPSPSFGLLHAWSDPEFEAAVAAIPNVVIQQELTNPIATTSALAGEWSADAKPLTGSVTPGLYKDTANALWWVIQAYNTATYPDPILIPALIRLAKVPGEVLPWVQPLDQFDAYKLVNAFSGKPDECTHKGTTWVVTQADGSGNNVWEPSVFGWTVKAGSPQPIPDGYPTWVQPTGAHDAYKLNAKVSWNGFNWNNTGSDANVYEPGVWGWVKI